MGEYNICFSVDNTYAEQLGVAITSILKNSDKDEKFNFYVLDGGITDESKNKIKTLTYIKEFKISYIKMNTEEFKHCPIPPNHHFTMATYFRYKIASIFSKLDKILYLDCDVVVLDSLKELYETDLADNYAAMALDVESENEAERLNVSVYHNAGIGVLNLKKWREDNIEQKLFEYTANNIDKILWVDQDVLNVVLKDKIKLLPRKWNFQFFQYDKSRYEGLFEKYYEYNIIHFAGRYKPWNNEVVHPLFNEYYLYLRLTPWKSNLVNYKKQAFDKFLKSNLNGSDEEVINTKQKTEEKVKEAEFERAGLREEIVKIASENNIEIYKEIENIRNFFEEAVKTQLEIVSRTYENSAEQQKIFYQQKAENQIKYQENVFDSSLENQKTWYENEIQKQINENNNWHINNLNEKLEAEKEFYKKELTSKNEYYNNSLSAKKDNYDSSLSELKNKLQGEISCLKAEITNLQECLKELQARESELLERESELQASVIEKNNEIEKLNLIVQENIKTQEEQKLKYEKELKNLKEYYELKIKPVAKLISLIEKYK